MSQTKLVIAIVVMITIAGAVTYVLLPTERSSEPQTAEESAAPSADELVDSMATTSRAAFFDRPGQEVVETNISPDNNWIAILTRNDRATIAWLYDADEQQSYPVSYVNPNGSLAIDSWSPDSQYVVFREARNTDMGEKLRVVGREEIATTGDRPQGSGVFITRVQESGLHFMPGDERVERWEGERTLCYVVPIEGEDEMSDCVVVSTIGR